MTTQLAWKEFYQNIKDPSWPVCHHINDFDTLPDCIKDEIIHEHNGGIWFGLNLEEDITDFTGLYLDSENYTSSKITNLENKFDIYTEIDDIKVYYRQDLDGGGLSLCKDYPDAIRFLYADQCFDSCLEWCSGPGFIGFALFTEKICNHLYLNDFFEPAILACNKTIDLMPASYKNRVRTIHAESLADFPAEITFDLVVANPPHFPNFNFLLASNNKIKNSDYRIEIDQNWKIHKNFFSNIKKYLRPNAKIVLVENINGMSPWDMKKLFDSSEFQITRCFRFNKNPLYWYCEIVLV